MLMCVCVVLFLFCGVGDVLVLLVLHELEHACAYVPCARLRAHLSLVAAAAAHLHVFRFPSRLLSLSSILISLSRLPSRIASACVSE